MVRSKFTILDLFAGCGGLTEGFEQSGFYKFVGAVEWEKRFCETLAYRLESKWKVKNTSQKVIHFDIQDLKTLYTGWNENKSYSNHIGLDKLVDRSGGLDIVVGGPPCQAYSIAGRVRDEHGMHYDYRNYLFESYVDIVARYQPKVFVFENVLGMLSANPGGVSITDRIYDSFEKIGYQIEKNLRTTAVFNTADFGVPQNRKRVIIFGVRKDLGMDPDKLINSFYENLNKKKRSKRKTVKDAIMDMKPLYPVKGKPIYENGRKYSHSPISTDVSWHKPRYHNPRDVKIFKLLTEDIKNGEHKYKSVDSIKSLYTEITGNQSNVHKYYVLRENEPSNTIPAHLYKDGLRHIHPDPAQARTITVREAARLQTFPDNFNFLGSQSDAYKMIGNAVPPLFAKQIAIAVKETIK